MRLFVGIDLPEKFRKRIGDIQKDIGEKNAGIKFVEPENLHYTLKFLGDVSEEGVEEIKNILAGVAEGVQKFTAEISNLGYFGSGSHIRVLWIGVGKGREEFIKLSETVDKKLSYIRKDEFPPSPHLTIGRVNFVKEKERFLEQLKTFNNVEIGSFEVKELKLKQSVLGRGGPVYKGLADFELR